MPAIPGVERVATQRLIGRRPQPADLEAWTRWSVDPRIDEAAWPQHLRTAPAARAALERALAHWERWGFGPWTVLRDGTPVGRAGLAHTRVQGRPEVEVAWLLDPDHWGQGYATEIAGEALRVAFDLLELDSVVALTTPANRRSLGVVHRLGLTHERDVEHAGLPHRVFRRHRPA